VLYVPSGEVQRREVLVVDDVIYTGRTHAALMRYILDKRGKVAGLRLIASIGEMWRPRIGGFTENVKYLISIKEARP